MLRTTDKATLYDYDGGCTFYLGAIVVTLICQALAGVVSVALKDLVPNISNNGDFNTAFMIVIQLCNLAFIWLFTRLRNKKLNFSFVKNTETGEGVTVKTVLLPVAAAVVFMAAVYLPTVWYGFLLGAMGVPEDAGALNLTTPSAYVMLVIASVFLAPMFEETIYRGVLLHSLKSELTAVRAALLSALAFMLMHMSPLQVVVQFSLGVLSAFIALGTGRLLPSVILHAAANATALVIELTPMSGVLASCVEWLTENPAAAVFITLGFVAAGGAVLYVTVRLISGKPILPRRESEAPVTELIDEDDADAVRERALREAHIKSGSFKYWTGVGISAVMLIISLITFII